MPFEPSSFTLLSPFTSQESGVHSIVPIEVLRETPLPRAVAAIDLKTAAADTSSLPDGTSRYAISVSGTESEDELLGLRVSRSVRRNSVSCNGFLDARRPQQARWVTEDGRS